MNEFMCIKDFSDGTIFFCQKGKKYNVELYIDHRLLTRCEYLIILPGANMNISINSDRFKNHFMDMCKYREEQIKKIL